MARARNIKPGLFKNEDLAECSVWARYIFPGLWMLADRDGRLEDRPKRIKGELLPFDSQDIEPLLQELASMKDAQGVPFIIRYQNSDGRFIQISKFSTHQTPHYSEKKSVIKPPYFQESPPDDPQQIPSGLPENSGNDAALRGGRNPLNPDSLNPDSPIPDSLNPERHATGFPSSERASMAGAVCIALKASGIGDVNPGHPDLLALLKAGAEIQNFVDAARNAAGKGKGFAYVLGTVRGQLQDSRQIAATGVKAAAPLGSSGGQARANRMAEANPGLATLRPVKGEIIDMEARDVTARRLG